MNDRFLIEVLHGGHETILELLFRFDADVTQHRASELGEEALDEIEPRAVCVREGELEAAGRLLDEPGIGLFGDVRGMTVEDQLDRCVSWIDLLLIEDLAQGALGQLGETAMPLRRPMLTRMAGKKARRPQFVWVAEFLGLTASQVFKPSLGFSGDRRCLA